MAAKLLVDYMPFNVSASQINESIEKNNGKLIVKGILQRKNAVNQNGRSYPDQILEREVEKYKKINVAEKRALGELDHPDSSTINLANVSHNIISMEWNGDDLIGEVEVLSTPSGNILKELFKSGIKLGISSRGVGSVKTIDEDVAEVQDDYELLCFDFVSNPSTHGAFLKPTNEGREYNKNSKLDRINDLITTILCTPTNN